MRKNGQLAKAKSANKERWKENSYNAKLEVAAVEYSDGETDSFAYAYDALNRPTTRNSDTFGYNARSEVTAAYIGGHSEMHEYDNIGNSILATFNGTTNTYTANNLNQCTYIQVTSAPSAGEVFPAYDADGNMTQCGDWTCAYDAENRLIAVYPISPVAGSLAVVNRYGHRHRRVRKIVNVMVAAQGKRGHTLFCDIILP